MRYSGWPEAKVIARAICEQDGGRQSARQGYLVKHDHGEEGRTGPHLPRLFAQRPHGDRRRPAVAARPRRRAGLHAAGTWSAVKKGLDPMRFTVRTAPEALMSRSSAWKDYCESRKTTVMPVLKGLARSEHRPGEREQAMRSSNKSAPAFPHREIGLVRQGRIEARIKGPGVNLQHKVILQRIGRVSVGGWDDGVKFVTFLRHGHRLPTLAMIDMAIERPRRSFACPVQHHRQIHAGAQKALGAYFAGSPRSIGATAAAANRQQERRANRHQAGRQWRISSPPDRHRWRPAGQSGDRRGQEFSP